MKKTKIINADKNFVKFIRFKFPGVKDPERTRKLLDDMTMNKDLSKKIDELLHGKRKKKDK